MLYQKLELMLTKFKVLPLLQKSFLGIVFIYSIIALYYFLQKSPGGDEMLFIADLELIKKEGWMHAIEKNISIPYMLLVYPLSLLLKNYVALRLVNVLLLILLFVYFAKRKDTFEFSFYGYLLFFISTVGYFFFGINDTLFFLGLIIYLNEVNQLQKNNKWNGTLAIIALLVSFFTRKLIFVYSPILIFSWYIIYKYKGFKSLNIKLLIPILVLFLGLNVPSFLHKGNISYDLKNPPKNIKATWTQRQYLAQLMVNEGSLPDQQHPSWEKTDAYLIANGENSLPENLIDGLFFDINLTVKEFFKELYSCMFYGFRQLGLILFIPLVFLIKDILKTKKLNISMMIPICLLVMICIFSLIIISFMELRWLAPVFILTIVYFSDLQKEKIWNSTIIKANYFVLLFLSFYGIFSLWTKF